MTLLEYWMIRPVCVHSKFEIFAVVLFCGNVFPLVVSHGCTFLASQPQTMRRKARNVRGMKKRDLEAIQAQQSSISFNWFKQMQPDHALCIISHKKKTRNLKRNLKAIEQSKGLFLGYMAYFYMAIWLYGYIAIWQYGNMGIWLYGFMGIWVTNLEAIERSESLLLNELQLVSTEVELLQACAKIHESFPVNLLHSVL